MFLREAVCLLSFFKKVINLQKGGQKKNSQKPLFNLKCIVGWETG